MGAETFAERLARLIPPARSERAFAKEVGLSPAGLRGLLHKGNSPTLETLVSIARVRGVSVDWLATGEGSQFPAAAETPSFGGRSGFSEDQAPYLVGPDPELMGRIVDIIERVHGDAGVRLPPVDKGRLAAEKYNEIVAEAADPEEWPALLDLLAIRLKRALRAAAIDPASSKREA